MGLSTIIYLGPWVEFRVPAKQDPKWAWLKNDAMTGVNINNAPPTEGDKVVFRYIPNAPRAGGPQHRNFSKYDMNVFNLSAGKPEWEMDADKLAMLDVYSHEITTLGQTYGTAPIVCWGLLTWRS